MKSTVDLAAVLATPGPLRTSLRQAVVQTAATSSVTIRLGGGTTDIAGVSYLRGYVPAAGDTVWVLQSGPDLLVLGPAWSGSGVEMTSASIAADQGTTSTASYVDLATVGPSVTVWGSIFTVEVGCQAYNVTAGSGALMSWEAIGPTSSFAADSRAYGPAGFTGVVNALGSRTAIFAGTLGTWTFKALYKAVTGGTARFLERHIVVVRFA